MTFKPSFQILRRSFSTHGNPMGIRRICRRSSAILIHGPHSRSTPGLSALRSSPWQTKSPIAYCQRQRSLIPAQFDEMAGIALVLASPDKINPTTKIHGAERWPSG